MKSSEPFLPKVGQLVVVPKKNGRGIWWVKIVEVAVEGRVVKVSGGTASGKPWFVPWTWCSDPRVVRRQQRQERKRYHRAAFAEDLRRKSL